MPRYARFDEQGYFYHIICRGQRRDKLFLSNEDKKVFCKILNKIINDVDIEIFAYCIMDNHIHLLLYRDNYPLQSFMKRLNVKYSLYFNKKHDLSGHVFQGRYKSYVVLNEKYLCALIKYIHENPIKAGLVENGIIFKYSSASFYEGKEEKNIPKLKMIGFANSNNYTKTVDTIPDKYDIYKNTIGTEQDYNQIEKRKTGRSGQVFKEKRELRISKIKKQLIGILKKENVTFEEFFAMKYSRKFNCFKKKIYKKLIFLGNTISDIAHLMNVHYSSISRIISKNK